MEGVFKDGGNDLTLAATELRLGLPGIDESSAAKDNKRASPESADNIGFNAYSEENSGDPVTSQPPKAHIVGWPPVRSNRKNNLRPNKTESESGIYVKVSMDGAPYLRKIDLKVYKGYSELLKALKSMFKFTIEREGHNESQYAPAYEDKDGDLMLVGDVPWDTFVSSCKRLRIMKGSEARGLGCGA